MNRWPNSLQEQTSQLSLKRKHSPIATRKIWNLLCPALPLIIQIESIKIKSFLLRSFPNYRTRESKTASCNCILSLTLFLFYVQVTVHRDKLRIKQPTRCIKYPKLYFVIKLYMFRTSSVPIIRSYVLYTRQLARFMQVMWPLHSNLSLLESGHIICMKLTNCRVYSR